MGMELFRLLSEARPPDPISRTSHALILERDGSVWGTGGNIYGPLGRHGLGEEAIRCGRIVADARAAQAHAVQVNRWPDVYLMVNPVHIGTEPPPPNAKPHS